MIRNTLIRSVDRLLNRAGYSLQRNSKRNNYSFYNLLDKVLLHQSEFRFIQIGGCDGISFDPLFPYIREYSGNISGVIVEPVLSYAMELEELYSELNGVEVVQKAIHAEAGTMKFFRADMNHADNLPDYAKGVASFNKKHLMKFKIPEEYIIEEYVDCISLNKLLRERNINHIDLLQIDSEGYDAGIIKQVNFSEFRPSVIRFEHGLRDGTMDGATFSEVISLLNRENYDCIVEDYDVTACLRELL